MDSEDAIVRLEDVPNLPSTYVLHHGCRYSLQLFCSHIFGRKFCRSNGAVLTARKKNSALEQAGMVKRFVSIVLIVDLFSHLFGCIEEDPIFE